jgi:7,8-dihydroneopterin aldolase/epimerase/oxygenase
VIEIELRGVEVFGYHGVLEEERRVGQTFLVDVWLGVPATALSDRIEDTVDYREVAELVRVVSDGKHFDLLEALAAAVADLLMARFDVERVRVRVRKTEPYGVPVDWAAATVERRR